MTRDELGLAHDHLRGGVRLGMIAAGLITAAVVIVALVPGTAGFFDDDRVDVSFTDMALRVLVVIPLGTVLVEEVIFRGVLHGLLRRRFDIRPAALGGATAFGLWHLFPVWRSYDDAAFGDLGRWGTILGTFVATFIAGLGFIWLRHRSGHLIAPVFAHIATNSVPFVVAWVLA
jgi:membrane protease YdiL (CAAX protease family)